MTTFGRRRSFLVLLIAAVVHHVGGANFQTVFDAVDTNGDRTITEDEFNFAVNRLVGGVGDVAAGVVSVRAAIDNSGGVGGSIIDAPPLGMDSPAAFFRQQHLEADATGNKEKITAGAAANTKKRTMVAGDAAFFKGLVSSFSTIMATEIGDKTFFIAAVLSMRNDRVAVFGGAILALIVMTILSTLMGLVLPALMPRKYTHIVGALLFLYFGCKLLKDSRGMEDKVSEELEEVEEELAEMSKKRNKARKKRHAEEKNGTGGDDSSIIVNDNLNVSGVDIEGGDGENGGGDGAKKRRGGKGGGGGSVSKGGSSNASSSKTGVDSSNSWESVFLQALTISFLAEWGDRSQIATIALAAAKDPVGVTIGGCMAHTICTGMAVLGGRMLASRISEKSVAFYGGLTFLVFGIHSLFFEE